MSQKQVLESLMQTGFEILRIECDVEARVYRLRLKGANTLDATIGEQKITYTVTGKDKTETVTNIFPLEQYQAMFPQKLIERSGMFRRYKVADNAMDRFFALRSLISKIPPNVDFTITTKSDDFTIKIHRSRASIVYSLDYLYLDGYQELQPTRHLRYNGQEHRGTDLEIFKLYISIITSLINGKATL